MKKKLIGFGIAIIIVVCCWMVDYVISMGYTIHILDIDPEVGIADGQTTTTIQVQLTRTDGTPVEGHDLNILSINGGTWVAYKQRTDADGMATFVWYPYLATSIRPAGTVTMRVRDQSTSIFIAVPPAQLFSFEVVAPDDDDGGMTAESFFGGGKKDEDKPDADAGADTSSPETETETETENG